MTWKKHEKSTLHSCDVPQIVKSNIKHEPTVFRYTSVFVWIAPFVVRFLVCVRINRSVRVRFLIWWFFLLCKLNLEFLWKIHYFFVWKSIECELDKWPMDADSTVARVSVKMKIPFLDFSFGHFNMRKYFCFYWNSLFFWSFFYKMCDCGNEEKNTIVYYNNACII